jgi:mycofactocin system transcriptional regulator
MAIDAGTPPSPAAPVGRPRATTALSITAVALELFERDGYDATTVEAIAEAVGISRRTFFRYFPSKNDVVWGDFSTQLQRFAAMFDAAGDDEPTIDVVRRSIVAFNDYGPDAEPELRARMALITTTPSLQGHAMLRHAEWCDVIARFVADRLGEDPTDLWPVAVAQAALGISTATFRVWIVHGGDLLVLLEQALVLLAEPPAAARSGR